MKKIFTQLITNKFYLVKQKLLFLIKKISGKIRFETYKVSSRL